LETLTYLDAAYVRALLERKGLSVEQLAPQAGCSARTIHRALAGRPIKLWSWRRIDQALEEAPERNTATMRGFVS
jgi:lambda repressor-like predicted transcriptional regulator